MASEDIEMTELPSQTFQRKPIIGEEQRQTSTTQFYRVGSTTDESEESDDFPGDRGALSAYIVLLGSFLTLFSSFGLAVSIGVVQDYWQYHQLAHYSAQQIGWIPAVFVYLMLAMGIGIGPILDRHPPRRILLPASIAYVVMIFLLAECSKYWQFLLCLGFLGGPCGAVLTTAGLQILSHWFKAKRGFASGFAMVGNSLGGVVIALVLRNAFPRYGYAWCVRALGFVFLFCLALGNILVRPRLKPSSSAMNARIFSLELYRQPSFTYFTATLFGIEFVLFGSLGILPTYARLGSNYPPATSFYVIAVLNATSCFGRIIPGYISDIWGRFNVLGVTIIATLVLMLVVWLPFGHTNITALYVFVAFYGFSTGSWMAMTPACLGQLSGPYHFGRYYGTCYFIASIATFICIPISGEIVDRLGPQALVGFMCAVLALTAITFAMSRWACLGWKWKTWTVI